MQYLVYKVTFPNNKVYIGITSLGINKRKKLHFSELKKGTNYKFHNALRKYNGTEIWEELCCCFTWEIAKETERYFIKYFDSFYKGYNSTLGGDGTFGRKHSETSKIKMRGKRISTSLALKGKIKTQEHRVNLSRAALGRKLTAETKNKISKKMQIRNSSRDWQVKASIANGGKPFKVLTLTNKEIGVWISQRQCARDLNINQSHVAKCLKHISKQHKGYIFNYIEETIHAKVQ